MNPGFYKKESNGVLYAPNGVYSPSFSLLKENKDNYIYPIDDWYWFDSDEEAYSFFGLSLPN